MSPSVRCKLMALAAIVLLYWAHRALQRHHHAHCKATLVHVVMFGQSNLCASIQMVLDLVENGSKGAMMYGRTHVMGLLGSVVSSFASGVSGGVQQMHMTHPPYV